MPQEADDGNSSVTSQPHCQIDKTFSGGEEGECHNPGEVRYREALLCEAHATLLKAQDRAQAVLGSVFRMDEWMEGNGGAYGASETKLWPRSGSSACRSEPSAKCWSRKVAAARYARRS